MVREVITKTEDTLIEEAADLMLEHKIGCLPVLRDDKLAECLLEQEPPLLPAVA